jgi:hypothetical protein
LADTGGTKQDSAGDGGIELRWLKGDGEVPTGA